MNLYTINQAILDTIDLETGEILDTAAFDQLQMERDEKIENIALWIKNLKSEAVAYRAEKDAFAEKQKRAENKADSLTKYLDSVLAGQKFKSVKAEVSYRKSTALNVQEGAQAPEAYLKWSEPTIDKAGLTKAIKDGQEFEGFSLVEKNNIQIK